MGPLLCLAFACLVRLMTASGCFYPQETKQDVLPCWYCNLYNAYPAEINGDGIDDILFVSSVLVGYFQGNSNGTFDKTPIALAFPASGLWGAFIPIDYDNDGDSDVIAEGQYGDLALWINNGGVLVQSYSIGPPIASGTNPMRSLKVVDMDNDGRLDVVVSTYTEVTWYRNLGNASWAIFPSIQGNLGTIWTNTIVDVDNDGRLDVVMLSTIGSASTHLIRWAKQLSNGTMTALRTIVYTNSIPDSCTFIDLNGDGILDLVYNVRYYSMYYLLGTGNGAFIGPYTIGPVSNPDIMAVDLNRDGRMDLYVPSSQTAYLVIPGLPTVNFTIVTGIISPDPYASVIIYSRDFFYGLNASQGLYSSAITTMRSRSAKGPQVQHLGSSSGSYISTTSWDPVAMKYKPSTYAAPTLPQGSALAAADLTGDGAPDVVYGTNAGVFLLKNPGNLPLTHPYPVGTSGYTAANQPDFGFFPSVQLSNVTWVNSVAIGDADGDGLLDIAVCYTDQQRSYPGLMWHKNLGGGKFDAGTQITSFNTSYIPCSRVEFAVIASAVGGSPKAADMIVDTQYGSSWYPSQGSGKFLYGQSFNYALYYSGASYSHIGDFDGDGWNDFIAYEQQVNQLKLYLKPGSPTPGPIITLPTTPAESVYGAWCIGDVDGDGKMDVVYPSEGYYRQGPNITSWKLKTWGTTTQNVNPGWCQVADINNDGQMEVIVGNQGAQYNGVLWIWMANNDVNQSYTPHVWPYDGSTSAGSVVLSDLNGDGLLDIARTVPGTSSTFAVQWYPNAQCTVAPTTFAPTTGSPTRSPTTKAPTALPPTLSPTIRPTTSSPTKSPTTSAPTLSPTPPTTLSPTLSPTTLAPSHAPTTMAPSLAPTTNSPTQAPSTIAPTTAPTTLTPTTAPTTLTPTAAPTTSAPSSAPSTSAPTTISPTTPTTRAPSSSPTIPPTTASPTQAADNKPKGYRYNITFCPPTTGIASPIPSTLNLTCLLDEVEQLEQSENSVPRGWLLPPVPQEAQQGKGGGRGCVWASVVIATSNIPTSLHNTLYPTNILQAFNGGDYSQCKVPSGTLHTTNSTLVENCGSYWNPVGLNCVRVITSSAYSPLHHSLLTSTLTTLLSIIIVPLLVL